MNSRVNFPLPCKVLSHLEGQAMECGRYKPGQRHLGSSLDSFPYLAYLRPAVEVFYVGYGLAGGSDKDQSDGLFSLRKKERSEVMQNKQQQRIQAPSIDGEPDQRADSQASAYNANASLALAELPLAKAVKALSKPTNPCHGIQMSWRIPYVDSYKADEKSNPKLYNISGSSLYPQAPFFFLFLTLLAGSRNYLTSGTTELDYSFSLSPSLMHTNLV
ncbi:hypothetical protein L1987_89837 [Smallanthus sonchifolius]|nr:hypothetical protein L1987_89837 [Smallanthus sonchifolius]